MYSAFLLRTGAPCLTLEKLVMKKTLVALAALAASAAFAQSSVTLYGSADVGYGTNKASTVGGTADTKTSGVNESTWTGNRLGFRGAEDLGGGMKASFVLEQGYTIANNGAGGLFGQRVGASGHQTSTTTAVGTGAGAALLTGGNGTTTSTTRQSFVGLSGGFGEVRVGYQYTNLYTLASMSGYVASTEGASGGDIAHLSNPGNVGGNRANGFTYIAPAFGGVVATIQYGSGGAANWDQTVAGATTSAKRTSVMLSYANGPLKVAGQYTSQKNNTGVVATTGTGKLTSIGASYDFGVASVHGTYNTGNSGVPAGAAVDKTKAHQIGVKVPFGALTAYAAIGSAEEKNGATGAKLKDISTQQFGALYSLSKRTTLYAVTGTSKDKVAEAGAAGTFYKGSSTRFGVNHTF